MLPEKAVDGKREPEVIIDKTEQATGIDFYKGTLFFATHKRIVRYDNVEDKLDNLGEPTAVLTDKLPTTSARCRTHGQGPGPCAAAQMHFLPWQ